ncbi:hypothetical protein T05_9341 [Trichinella murrelli]|uniref:Uncharacterized protein n=1 Tax=Trichinella murrelli TaxID=144512 RepID=A0A0V0U4J6_9BILA|nr:hypothetical protein T05_9341 [Trichinella murrelli]
MQRYLILKNRCTKSFSIYVQLIRQGCIYQKIIQIPTSKSPTYAMKKTIMPNGSITLFIITARLLALENEVCDEDVKPTGGTLLPIRELNCSSIKNKSKKLRDLEIFENFEGKFYFTKSKGKIFNLHSLF